MNWIRNLFRRDPDIYVGGRDNPYMKRWYILPRNRLFNIYLHQFLRHDDDRALHDHPWCSLSIVLKGGYYDITPGVDGTYQRRWYGTGSIIFRRPSSAHRVELSRFLPSRYSSVHRQRPAWTLFITGPRVRDWGFLCPKGWVHWRDFTAGKDGETIGKGCN